MNAREFLQTLWGTDPPGYMQLWELAGRRSTYWRTAVAISVDGQHDTFTAVGTTARPLGARERAKAGQIAAIAGLWLDIDDDKTPCRHTLAEAVARPTLLIDSGHGLHAWHLFDEPWVFRSEDERERAALMARQWVALHQAAAARAGGRIDPVADLARVMRLPGTINAKDPDDPRPVRVVEHGARRYERAELAALCAQAGPIFPAAAPGSAGTVDLDGDTPQFAAKLNALIANSPEFAATWEHRALPGDGSLSAIDLSLCTRAAAAMTDPELRALIQAHRARWGGPGDQAKGERRTYLALTIGKARAGGVRDETRAALDALARRAA